jgi:single-stranded-DNA-specific exonuclease
LPDTLPQADAVVNPKRLPPDHPLATLPGVGVAYKLAESLLSHAGCPELSISLADLAALGIVADVAVLRDDTRYLLQIGLAQLRQDQRPGLRALYRLAQLDPVRLTETDIAFQIAPRLNAAGRLDDARLVVELLSTADEEQADVLALRLDGLNRQRQLYERQIFAAAQSQIEQDPSLLDWEVLVLHNPNWHPGVLGIVANRLASLYQRPVVLLASSGNVARGSARSAGGYDIHAAIAAQADLLLSFGGHPGAAGLSLPVDHIPAFRRRLSDTLTAMPAPESRARLAIDALVRLDEVTPTLAHALQQLAPFGEGNPRPVLASERLSLLNAAFIGREQAHRRLTVADEQGHQREVIWWNSAAAALPTGTFDLAFQIEISHYRDQEELQLTLVDFRPSATETVTVAAPTRMTIDRRSCAQPQAELAALRRSYPDALVWAEGYRRSEAPGVPLSALRPAQTLIIYTAPCTPYALAQAVQQVDPLRVVLIGTNPPLTRADEIFRRLLELFRYVLARQAGSTTLRELAEAVAQPERVIRLALSYIQSAGVLTREEDQEGKIVLARLPSHPANADGDPVLWAAFQSQVAETAAYRTFFRRATLEQLFSEGIHHDALSDPGADSAH